MLRKYSNSRSLSDNIKLGSLSAFAAGMVNIGSLLLFFSFSSNVTGHYAILAAELVKGNLYQIAVVFSWIFLFFLGSFVSNLFVIHINAKNSYIAHSIPLFLEIICLVTVAVYGEYYYRETLAETEILLALMLFAMGLQNGLTASISNFAVKTTHLTGTTTDLGVLFSMFTKKEFRTNETLKGRAKLLVCITLSYLSGAVTAGFTYTHLNFKMFYMVSLVLVIIIIYDLSKLKLKLYWHHRKLIRLRIEDVILIEESKEKSVAS
ncbi:YoaK family protein [Flavobacterium sp.]|uniref:YoaK family protein n=1 Tax=Flavobacterium sp. TaxID=239 RepID=UPI002FDEE9EB